MRGRKGRLVRNFIFFSDLDVRLPSIAFIDVFTAGVLESEY